MINPIILFENSDALVIDKPAGVSVHGDGVRTEPTLADWLLEQYPELKDVGESITLKDGTTVVRPGIVHRLDKDTSGVLLIAKNPESFTYFKEQFKNREVQKTYNAFVYGVVKEDKGIIDFSIGRSRKDFRLRSAQPRAKGDLRDAITTFKVLKRSTEYSYLELEPKTGRMHQIRVHLKAIHHPVVCDPLYAPNHPPGLGFTRLALHARKLSLLLPSGERNLFESPLPADFEEALALLSRE